MTAPPIRDSGSLVGRIPVLDGLRSVVMIVLVAHFTINVAREGAGWMAAPIYGFSLAGVAALDIFFALSGFLITGILLDSKGAPGFFGNFYARRALRILPVYYGFLFGYLILLPRVAPGDVSEFQLDALEQLPYWLHYVNIPSGLGGRLAPYTNHFWSLSLEEQFYLVWPLVVFYCSRAQLRAVAIGSLVAAPIVRTVLSYALPDQLFFFSFTLGRLDGLALGALMALAWREPGALDRLATVIRRVGLVAAVLVVPLLALIVLDLTRGSFAPGWRAPFLLTLSSWYSAAVVVTLLQGGGGVVRRVAESPVARRIGLYSYAMYILHDPLAHLCDQFGWIARPGGEATPLSLLAYVGIMSAITFALAAASWHFLERPILHRRPPPSGGTVSSKS